MSMGLRYKVNILVSIHDILHHCTVAFLKKNFVLEPTKKKEKKVAFLSFSKAYCILASDKLIYLNWLGFT